ncbi:MAG: glycosyltransferase family 39 protein [Phycisphaerae bacterium]|nr:glycosyltransferase family 39 protein [Phycisphaerae bacterium]
MNAENDLDPRSCGAGVSLSTGLVLLVVFAIVVAFWDLGGGPALGDHEAIVAQSAREMCESGEWLIPHFNGDPFIRKPPGQTWLVVLASYVVDPPEVARPVSVLAARAPSAAAAVLTVLMVWALGKMLFGPRTALVAGAIMACCAATLFFSHNAQTEMLLTLFITAAFACFYRASRGPEGRQVAMAGFYAALGLGMLAKAPLPLAMVGVPLFLYWFVTVPLSKLLGDRDVATGARPSLGSLVIEQLWAVRWMLPGLMIFFLLAVPWPVYAWYKVPNALELWRTEFLDRYQGLLKEKPFWYYLPMLFAIVVPFSLSLPEALVAPFIARYRRDRAGLLYVWTWAVVQLVFLSTSAFKRPHYLLPLTPALSLLLAPVIDRLFFHELKSDRRLVRLSLLAIFGAAVVGGVVFIAYTIRKEPTVLWAAWTAMVITLVGVAVACRLFWRERREACLVTILCTTLLAFSWAWTALGRSDFDNDEIRLVAELERLSIGANDKITWAVGRPDSRLSYYGGSHIKALYTAEELASRRRGRLEVSDDLLLEGVARVVDRLKSDEEEYFIFEAEDLAFFRQLVDVEYREVVRVAAKRKGPAKSLVVITNKWNMGEEEDRLAG